MKYRENECIERLAEYATKALLYEVAATPKPGLVDRANNGAHQDMDFYTFLDSSVRLQGYFYKIASVVDEKYKNSTLNFLSSEMIFSEIKNLGIKAEEQMLDSTNGVNTHKGAIFSIGLIVSAAAEIFCIYGSRLNVEEWISKLRNRVSEYISPELGNHFKSINEPITYGEEQYLKYGLTGARGEAASGFSTVFSYGLPALEEALMEGLNINEAMVQALLNLMCHVEDSNVIGRHNPQLLALSKDKACEVIRMGGMKTTEGIEAVYEYDGWCIEKNISHGGCADLLAVTVLIWMLKNDLT